MPVSQQRGFSIVPALFVVVIGALVGASLAALLSAGNQSIALLAGQTRARAAAATGLEWARYRVDRLGLCANVGTNLAAGALTGFRVAVSCARSTHSDGATSRSVFALRAFAQYGDFGQPDYVSYSTTATLVR